MKKSEKKPTPPPVRVQRLISACRGGADRLPDLRAGHRVGTRILSQSERQARGRMDVPPRAWARVASTGWRRALSGSREPDVQGGVA